MSQSIRESYKRINELGERLSPDYRHAFTDVITNLRTSSLEEATAEEAIEDVLELLLSAQERGEPVERVIGKDVKHFCADIVASSQPKRVTWNKVLGQLSLWIICAGMLWAMEIVQGLLRGLIRGIPASMSYSFTWGTLLKYFVCYLFIQWILRYIGRDVKSEGITSRNRLVVAALFLVNLALLISLTLWMPTTPLFTANSFVIAASFIVAYFLCSRLKTALFRRS